MDTSRGLRRPQPTALPGAHSQPAALATIVLYSALDPVSDPGVLHRRICFLALALVAACSPKAGPEPTAAPEAATRPKSAARPPGAPGSRASRPGRPPAIEGLASFYGPGFHGRLTASGERFDRHALTAAHRKLAFGTCLDVTNVGNGKRVRVRVNDRGPFIRGRVLDVSEGAARKLGMLESGLARVRALPCD